MDALADGLSQLGRCQGPAAHTWGHWLTHHDLPGPTTLPADQSDRYNRRGSGERGFESLDLEMTDTVSSS